MQDDEEGEKYGPHGKPYTKSDTSSVATKDFLQSRKSSVDNDILNREFGQEEEDERNAN